MQRKKQMKAQLQVLFKTKSIKIQTKNLPNGTIDCLLIYSNQPTITLLNKTAPTILYCNPNAGYYETIYYDSQWIDFYLSKGINIMLWNYRGYGSSSGQPTPQNIFEDGECLINYMKEVENMSRIGIHGQSLGGMVACYLAFKTQIDFLCADRTFSCISDVAFYGISKYSRNIIKLLLNKWDIWSPLFYLNCSCYKVITFDDMDGTIPYLACLKNGVSRHNLCGPQRICSQYSIENAIKELFTKAELLELFDAFVRIRELVIKNIDINDQQYQNSEKQIDFKKNNYSFGQYKHSECVQAISEVQSGKKEICEERNKILIEDKAKYTFQNREVSVNLQKQIVKIFRALYLLQGGFLNIFSVFSGGVSLEMFMQFISNIYVWENYGNIEIFIQKLEKIMFQKWQKKHDNIFNDLQIIYVKISYLYSKMLQFQKTNINITSNITNNVTINEHLYEKTKINQLGFLIQLKCGHNGQFSIEELKNYEIHLQNLIV